MNQPFGSPFSIFLSRFSTHREKQAPFATDFPKNLEILYVNIGVGWFKGNLLQIIEPALIKEIQKILTPLQKLHDQTPFAMNAIGDFYFISNTNSIISFYDFSNNTFEKMSGSLEEFFDQTLFQMEYHPSLNYTFVNQLSAKFGRLSSTEIFKAQLPILLGGEKKTENYQKSNLFTFLSEIVPLLLQWETLGFPKKH